MKWHLIKVSLLILCLTWAPYVAFPSSDSGYITPVSAKEGLNSSTIYDIYQDEKGFIWFSTDMGISRYDGVRMRNFPLTLCKQANSNIEISRAVVSISRVSNGLFMLRLQKGEMIFFDSDKELYIPISQDEDLKNQTVNSIYVTDGGNLYVGTTKGLYAAMVQRGNGREEDEIRVSLSGDPLVKGEVTKLSGAGEDLLFACVDDTKVVVYNINTAKAEFPKTENKKKISTLYHRGNYLWISSSYSDLEVYNLQTKNLHRIQGTDKSNKTLSDVYVVDITYANENRYFVATWNGLFSLEFDSPDLEKAVCTLDYIDNRYATTGERKMMKLLWFNKNEILWIGTFGSGAYHIHYTDKELQTLKQNIDTDILEIVEDAKGYIWLLTDRGRLLRSTVNHLSANTTFIPWTKGLDANGVYRMSGDRQGFLWLGDEYGNIININTSTEEVTKFSLAPEGRTDFSENICMFCPDSRGRLWIITSNELVLFNRHTHKSKVMTVRYNGEKIRSLNAIAEDKEGNIWLGTEVGLKRLEILGDSINLLGSYELDSGLEESPVYHIYVNNYNQILASYPNKILSVDGRNKEKTGGVFTLPDGLCSSHVYCMVDDENGNTWIGSNCGVMTVRNDRNMLYNYESLGYSTEVCRLRDGRLLWSNTLGLSFFDPLVVKTERGEKDIRLSEVRVNGDPVSVGEELNGEVFLHTSPDIQRKFTFGVRNSDFTFYFTDLSYGVMQRKQIYRLLPDEEWKMGAALEDGITFKNLPTGDYKLQVKLSYSDASESTIIEIPIQVKTYWWKTTWAKWGYLLIAITIVLLLCISIKRRQKSRRIHKAREMELRSNLKLAEMEQEQKQKFDTMRDQLLVKFMEELRTPLSLVMAPLKEMLRDLSLPVGIRPKLQVAYRNSLGMLDACNQLLAIYTQGSLSDKLNVAPYLIERIVDQAVFTTKDLVRINQIDFKCDKRIKGELEVWVDIKRISFVLHNLLTNAFNHVHHSGVVCLLLREVVRDGVSYCSITVEDNGKSKVRKVPKAGDDELILNMSDLELGYDVMEKIIQLHHGTIMMNSLEGEGTEITVELPADKEVLLNDSNILFVNPEPQEELEDIDLPIDDYPHPIPNTEEPMMSADSESLLVKKERETLLIIEDHKDIRLYLKVLFGKEYDLFLATNGQEGITLAIEEQPDLILCDVMMPIKDGFECCRELKERLETCHIPFIMLTAKVEDEDVIHGLELGADDYILKPFTPSILKAKVRNLINGRMGLKRTYSKLLMPPEHDEPEANETEEKIKTEDPFISTVMGIIEEKMCEPNFGVKALALELNMSQPTLYRKVKQSTDFTIVELIRGVRMRKAAMLLKQKIYEVQEVAEMIGYNDIPSFRKHFVDTFNTTPSTYSGNEDD